MKRILIGKVISTKTLKTVTVAIERKFRHPEYKKVVVRHKKIKAHNEDLPLRVGDYVKIKQTRPISKDKHFKVVEKVNK